MHPADVRFHREILTRLNHEIENTTTALLTGMVMDWVDYRAKVAKRAAFVECISIASDIEDEMMGREKKAPDEDEMKFPD